MAPYTTLTLLAMVAATVIDLWLLRTCLVRQRGFWVSLAIMTFFQVFVDGWLTRAKGTIVNYRPDGFSGVRVFFHTPIEDFGFGFALILLTLSVWHALGGRSSRAQGSHP